MSLAPITIDLHSHTLYSHAKDTPKDMAAAAFARGLDVFGFTEHSPRPAGYEYPEDYQAKLAASFPACVAEVLAEKERYKGRMDVLFGLEMDYMPDEEAFIRESLAAYPYEYVIGSVHFQGLWGFDFTAADWEGLSDASCGDIFVRYYHDQKRMAETGLFQIAGHPDLIKLFRKQTFHEWVETPDAREHVRAFLAALKQNGMAMEVSSAAIRKGLGEPYPCSTIMRMAREVGVPVSFGSDTHAVADVAFALDGLAAYAHSFGYTEHAFFRGGTMRSRKFV